MRAAALLLAGLAACATGSDAPATADAPRRPNVVFVLVDAASLTAVSAALQAAMPL